MERSEKLAEYASQVLDADEQIEYGERVASLVDSVGWPFYAEILKRLRIAAREGFEGAATMDDVRFTQGLIAGLQLASDVPSQLLELAEEKIQKEERRQAPPMLLQTPGVDVSF